MFTTCGAVEGGPPVDWTLTLRLRASPAPAELSVVRIATTPLGHKSYFSCRPLYFMSF
jgi:hypothetical protein